MSNADAEKDVAAMQESTDSVATVSPGESVETLKAVGAPTEAVSPLGYHVNWLSVIFLVSLVGLLIAGTSADFDLQNVSKMIGTGIFSVREYLISTVTKGDRWS
jgi:hypothetical protein